MNHLIWLFLVFFMLSLTSCNNKKNNDIKTDNPQASTKTDGSVDEELIPPETKTEDEVAINQTDEPEQESQGIKPLIVSEPDEASDAEIQEIAEAIEESIENEETLEPLSSEGIAVSEDVALSPAPTNQEPEVVAETEVALVEQDSESLEAFPAPASEQADTNQSSLGIIADASEEEIKEAVEKIEPEDTEQVIAQTDTSQTQAIPQEEDQKVEELTQQIAQVTTQTEEVSTTPPEYPKTATCYNWGTVYTVFKPGKTPGTKCDIYINDNEDPSWVARGDNANFCEEQVAREFIKKDCGNEPFE